QYNAILNGDFNSSNGDLYDWGYTGSVSVVSNSSTDVGNHTTADTTFGPLQNVARIVPGSAWAGMYPSDSNMYIPYVKGQTYTIGGLVKGLDATGSYIDLKFLASDKTTVLGGVNSPAQSGTFGWQYLTATLPANYTVPSGTTYIMPEFMTAPTSSNTPSDAKTWFAEMRLSIDPSTSTYGYDSSGNFMTSSTDPLGNKTQYSNDPFGDVTQVTDPIGNSISLTYDSDHNLSTQMSTPDNLQVGYTYDGDGNVTQVKETSSDGSTTYATNTSTYNSLDQLTASTDALGNQTTYAYDADGNLISTTLPDGHTIGATYDHAGEQTAVNVDGTTVNQFAYDADGDLTSISNSNGSTTLGYDKNGNITSQTDSTGSQSFTYNKDNALTSLAATIGGTTITTNFNLDNQDDVTSITNGSGTKLATYNDNEQGLNDTIVLGDGLKEAFKYDGDLHLQSLVIENGSGSTVGDYEYTYDADGNLTKVINGQDGSTIASYSYDAMNRLTKEVTPGGDTIAYTYDPMGNITAKTVTPSGSTTSTTTNYTYNADNELTAVGSQAYTYDPNGELTSDGTNTYKWNELGELTEVDNSSGPIATYTYDTLGRRVSETAGGNTTKFFYQGETDQVTYETDGNGNLLQSYTYGPNGEPLTLTTWSGGTGTTYYYVENGHGDVVALTDASGNIVAQYTYDAWGNILSSSGTLASTNPYRYAGYRWDDAVGMYYLNARYYSPTQMRFISQDPLGGSINEYTYADDNPVMEMDPTGEFGAGVLGLTGLADLAGFDAVAGWVPVIGWAAVGVTAVWGGYEVWHHYHMAQNLEKVDDKYLKKKGIDAHQLKKDVLGKKAPISHHDIYKDKNTGELHILRKGGKGTPIPTGEYID
ncbi:RHS repeat-associated core domain-containing protein, partial [Alicyclobacillus cycloheptanicus]